MTVHIGGATLSQVTDNSNDILEVGGTCAGVDRTASKLQRTSGDVAPSTSKITFNVISNYGLESGDAGGTSNRYTFPQDGIYLISTHWMIDNDATRNNDYYRLQINGSNVFYAYGSNWGSRYMELPNHCVLSVSAGDYVDLTPNTVRLHGTSTVYNDLTIIHVG